MACLISNEEENPVNTMDTIRLFLDTVEFSDELSNGWRMIFNMMRDALDFRAISVELLRWVVPYFSREIKLHSVNQRSATISKWLASYETDILKVWLDTVPLEAMELACFDGLNVLSTLVIRGNRELIVKALQEGMNPNYIGWATLASPIPESPTSLSMYSKPTFDKWCFALSKVGLSIVSVFDKALLEGPLPGAGWTQETMKKFLNWEPKWTKVRSRCFACKNSNGVLIQPVWVYALEEIKHRVHPDDTLWSLLEDIESDVTTTQEQQETVPRLQKGKRLGNIARNPNGYISVNESILESMKETFLAPKETFTASRISQRSPEKDLDSPPKSFNPNAGFQPFISQRDIWLCMHHWLVLLNIEWTTGDSEDDQDASESRSDTSTSPEHEFSPFHIHS